MQKEDTMCILSKFQKWITVTPKSKNRKRPLENQKKDTMDQTSRIMPKWMQLKEIANKESNRRSYVRSVYLG